MTGTWHAYASGPSLVSGTEILVTGGHERIRVRTADLISIEMPDGNRLSAVVIDRTGNRLVMVVGEVLVRMRIAGGAEAFEGFKLSDGFSRQGWTVQ
jgi:hypothetical protein